MITVGVIILNLAGFPAIAVDKDVVEIREALLRYAQPRVPGPVSPQHLAEEIQKLEAYPEANLPE